MEGQRVNLTSLSPSKNSYPHLPQPAKKEGRERQRGVNGMKKVRARRRDEWVGGVTRCETGWRGFDGIILRYSLRAIPAPETPFISFFLSSQFFFSPF